MADSQVGLLGRAAAWGRLIEKRLGKVEDSLAITKTAVSGMQDVSDKPVYASFPYGQNIANGVTGKVPLDWPTQVKYSTSTGLFVVTVSMSGLVMAGATLGMSFESEDMPANIYFDIPLNGVVASCANADVRYAPFSGSRSTIISTRPGTYQFSLYLSANTTATASSQAFVNEGQISVRAV